MISKESCLYFYIFNPISLSLSSRYSPAVIFVYCLGFSSVMQDSKQVKSICDLGWRKKGTEYREVPSNSLGGFTTRCVVDFNTLFVSLCNMSPTLTTMSSPCALTGNHSPSRVNTSNPSALAPMSKVIRLISSCAAERSYRDWETDRKSTRLNSSHRL